MVEGAGVSPAKDGSCSNMSMFKAWPCRHVGLETSEVRSVVLGLDASSTQNLGIYQMLRMWLFLLDDTCSGSISLAALVLSVFLLLFC